MDLREADDLRSERDILLTEQARITRNQKKWMNKTLKLYYKQKYVRLSDEEICKFKDSFFSALSWGAGQNMSTSKYFKLYELFNNKYPVENFTEIQNRKAQQGNEMNETYETNKLRIANLRLRIEQWEDENNAQFDNPESDIDYWDINEEIYRNAEQLEEEARIGERRRGNIEAYDEDHDEWNLERAWARAWGRGD